MVWNKGHSKYTGDTTSCEYCGKLSPHPRVLSSGVLDYTRRRFCSNRCASQQGYRNNKRPLVTPTYVCAHCGKSAERNYNKLQQSYNYKQRFCSKQCADKAQIKVDGSLDKSGYRIVNGQFEHRYVMEKMIGRKLNRQETVHHKNGNRADNQPENLELWSGRHGRGQRANEQDIWGGMIPAYQFNAVG